MNAPVKLRQAYADMPTYYAATANPARERPILRGDHRCDICVIGAGFSGMSAALELAERGYDVIVVEARRVGWGASGRNGGQLVNGYSRSLSEVRKHYGDQAERDFGAMALEGAGIIRERVKKYKIECDLRDGNAIVGMHQAHMRFLQERVAEWRRHGHDSVRLLEEEEVQSVVNSERYVGGYLDPLGGHMHSLNYVLGEAAAFENLGGKIFENSRIEHVDRSDKPFVQSESGRVFAEKLLICGNAYLGDEVGDLSSRVLSVSSQIIGTEVLGEDVVNDLIPANCAVEDARYIPDYYRRTADHRIIYGGGSVYGGGDPASIVDKIRPQMLLTFPELKNARIDFAWSGNFALTMTRYPQVGRLSPSVYYSQGDSGHGVTTTQMLGKRLAEAINGQLTKFDVFASLRDIPFVGGKVFRVPYCVLGSWYYGLRDRLGM